jgi:hypothetical protein
MENNNLKNWVKKGMITFSIATKRVEENTLNQRSEELDLSRDAQITPFHRNQLMADLKEGRVTQRVKEFRAKYYMVLKEAEKYKAKWGKHGDFELLTEDEIKRNKNAAGDPYDNYRVEVTVDNKAISSGLLETSTVRPVKVKRGVFPRNKIEDYSETVLIRDIDGKNKLIEFYIPNNRFQNQAVIKEVKYLKENPQVNDFVNVTNVSFTTSGGDGMNFNYRMLAFDKVVEYNGNYIVKMFAEVTEDPRWFGEKYLLD